MLTFRDMTLDDRDTVLPMVDAFYRSNAVDHPVPREIVERSFLAAAGNEHLLRASKERGELRKDHCDSLVLEMSRFLEELLREQST